MSFDSHHDPSQRIEDMLEAIASVKESVNGVTYEQFLANREKRQSVAYNIEVIEEKIKDMQSAFPWPIS